METNEIVLAVLQGLLGLFVGLLVFMGKSALNRISDLEKSDSDQKTEIAMLKDRVSQVPTLENIRSLLREEMQEIKKDIKDTKDSTNTMKINYGVIKAKLEALEKEKGRG